MLYKISSPKSRLEKYPSSFEPKNDWMSRAIFFLFCQTILSNKLPANLYKIVSQSLTHGSPENGTQRNRIFRTWEPLFSGEPI